MLVLYIVAQLPQHDLRLPLRRGGQESFLNGCRPRGPLVMSHPLLDQGPRGLCNGRSPNSPARSLRPWIGAVMIRVAMWPGPATTCRHSSSDRAFPRSDLARDRDCHLHVPQAGQLGPPTCRPDFPGLPDW